MSRFLPASLLALLALTGCGFTSVSNPSSTNALNGLHGKTFGGQQAIVGATVTLYAVGSSNYGRGASVIANAIGVTDANGAYTFNSFTCPAGDPPTYLLAKGGNAGFNTNANIMLAAGSGPCSGLATATVNLDETTTAVTAYAMSHFFTTTLGVNSPDAFGGTASGNTPNRGLALADNVTIPSLVDLVTKQVKPATANFTVESAKIYSLANILAACVNSAGQTSTTETTTACGQLFNLTTPLGASTRPSDTLQAAVQIALYPYQNVAALYTLPPAVSPFTGLSSQPNDWTVGVSYMAPNLGLSINGTASSLTAANMDIDATGRIWFPTNTATAHGLAFFDPEFGTFSGVYGTALTHPQYLAIDTQGTVWGTDLAANQVVGVSASSGATGTTFVTKVGEVTGPIAISNTDTGADPLIFASTSSTVSTPYFEKNGTITAGTAYTTIATGLAAFNVNNDATIWEGDVATSGEATPCSLEAFTSNGKGTGFFAVSSNPCISGGIVEVKPVTGESLITATTLNQVCSYSSQTCFTPPVPVSNPSGLAVDGDSNIWITNLGNSSVSTMGYSLNNPAGTEADYLKTSTLSYIHDANNGGTITIPFGIAIDGSGNVWIANASCVTTSTTQCTGGGFVLSELIGAAAPTVTPLALQTKNLLTALRPVQ